MRLHLDSFKEVFFCTGARNQELLKAFDNHQVIFEVDERMASFKALGLTKIQERPVAVCTTSGTAVAECVPAMLEALYSKAPLVIISGDRPKKLHGTGSPQTIDHETLTLAARGSYLELTLDEFRNFEISDPVWPVHINVLVDDTTPHRESPKSIEDPAPFLRGKSSPLFIFSHEEKSMRPFIEAFAKTGLPFYAETLSGGRDLSTISDERTLLKLWNEGAFDSVVRVGHTPLSKIWRLLEKKPIPTLSIDSRGLPGLSFGEVLHKSSHELISDERFWPELPKAMPKFPRDSKLVELIDRYPRSEIALMERTHDSLSEDDLVYLGNSLVVRFFELVQTKRLNVFGNRGVNGIDGQLATAIGVSMGTSKTVTCVLGDFTTLYDLSSLREIPKNLRLIIMNNGGARIFDLLKLDKRIVMEHNNNFKNICSGLGLTYSNDLGLDAQVTELFPIPLQTEAFLKEWSE
jgi:2-succinyl-5-enolpyruvyl-6-hydroxy-3-cyclohexene-1-carboxylate synthase